jgi:hypothetical protein
MPPWFTFVIIGVLGGTTEGFFGVGGGIVIIPALIYWVGFSQHMATGTSLAVLLPPIGLAAAYEYYRHGNVDVRAAAPSHLWPLCLQSWRVPCVWCLQAPRLALNGILPKRPLNNRSTLDAHFAALHVRQLT